MVMAAACVLTLAAAAVSAEAVPVREVLNRSYLPVFLADEFPSERLADAPKPRITTSGPEPEPPPVTVPPAPAPAPAPTETQAEAPKPQPPVSQGPAPLTPPNQSPSPQVPVPAAPSENPAQPTTPGSALTSPATQPPAPGPAKPVYRLQGAAMEVAITFDDGPSAYTQSIAAILKQEQVPAAFFWIAGSKRLDLSKELIAQGFQIGSHTISHVKLTGLDFAAQQSELARSQKALHDASQADIHLFRPPYGAYNADTLKASEDLGLSVILWNVDSRDWDLAAHPEQIVPGVMKQVKPGSIILLHERAQTLQVLPDLIRSLRDAGYTFKPLT